MRWSRQTSGEQRTEVENRNTQRRDRSYPVRMSILSWELFLLLLFIAGAGYLVVGDHEAEGEKLSTRARLRGHDTLLESVVYAPDGKTLISCGWDNYVRLWDVSDRETGWGREVSNLPSTAHLFSVAISPDSRLLAAGGVDGFTVWSLDGGQEWTPVIRKQGHSHRAVAFAPDGRTLALGALDGLIRLWDVGNRRELSLIRGLTDEVRRI